MPSPATENLTPRLQCPRCTQPFRILREKVGSLLRCKRCNCHFRLKQDAAGGYTMHPQAVGPTAVPAKPPTPAPRPPSKLSPATSHPAALSPPGKDKTAAPLPTAPDQPLPPDIDVTVLGKLIVLPNGKTHPPAAIEQSIVPIALSGPFKPAARRVAAGRSKRKGWLLVLLAVVLLSGLALLGYWFITWKAG